MIRNHNTKTNLTNAISTADKGEEELYVRNSFSFWNKTAACEPLKHTKELFPTLLTRVNAYSISRETSQTINIQKPGFGSPL